MILQNDTFYEPIDTTLLIEYRTKYFWNSIISYYYLPNEDGVFHFKKSEIYLKK